MSRKRVIANQVADDDTITANSAASTSALPIEVSEPASSLTATPSTAAKSSKRTPKYRKVLSQASLVPSVPLIPPSATLPLQTDRQTSQVLQHALYFSSDSWVSPLREDVNDLMTSFEEMYSGDGRSSKSPFELFKECWIKNGWSKIHLFGFSEGRARQTWGASIIRVFLEHLLPELNSTMPARTAAIFALYTFFSTQADSQEKIFIRVDPPTLEYILNLPTSLGPSLDSLANHIEPSTSSIVIASPEPAVSSDLYQILISLLEAHAFLLIPSESFMHPKEWPHVSLQTSDIKSEKKLEQIREDARLLRGIENELIERRQGLVEEEHDEQERDDELRRAKENYLRMKGENKKFLVDEEVVQRVLTRAKRMTASNLGTFDAPNRSGEEKTGLNLLNLVSDVEDSYRYVDTIE